MFQKCELNMDNLSKSELLTLLSVMEGELEARDLVIEALRVSPSTQPDTQSWVVVISSLFLSFERSY